MCNHVFILFFFFCPTDRPTFTRGRAMGNETFYWEGLRHVKKNTPELLLGVMHLCHVFANVQFV